MTCKLTVVAVAGTAIVIASLGSPAQGQDTTPCESEFVISIDDGPIERSYHEAAAADGLAAEWKTAHEVIVYPVEIHWRIAGSAGIEIRAGADCFLTMPDAYVRELKIFSTRFSIDSVGLGVCDPMDGICYWRTVERPVREPADP